MSTSFTYADGLFSLETLERECEDFILSLGRAYKAVGINLTEDLTEVSLRLDEEGWTISLSSTDDDVNTMPGLELCLGTGTNGTLSKALCTISDELRIVQDAVGNILLHEFRGVNKLGPLALRLKYCGEFTGMWFNFSAISKITGQDYIDLEIGYDSVREELKAYYVVKNKRGDAYLPFQWCFFWGVGHFKELLPDALKSIINEHVESGSSRKPCPQVEPPKSATAYQFDGQNITIPWAVQKSERVACMYVNDLTHSLSLSDNKWINAIYDARRSGDILWFRADNRPMEELIPLKTVEKLLKMRFHTSYDRKRKQALLRMIKKTGSGCKTMF